MAATPALTNIKFFPLALYPAPEGCTEAGDEKIEKEEPGIVCRVRSIGTDQRTPELTAALKPRREINAAKGMTGGKNAVSLQEILDDLDHVDLEALGMGEPFSDEVATIVRAVTGRELTQEGLRRFYADCLPGLRMTLTPTAPEYFPVTADPKRTAFAYRLSWLDSAGKEVAYVKREMGRDKDGSIEMYRRSTWVDPAMRGQAMTAKLLLKELALLKALSPHEHTRLTVTADQINKEAVGRYRWAKLHFKFMGDGLDLMKSELGWWLEDEVRTREISQEVAQRILQASQAWTEPWHFAEYDHPGLKLARNINGRIEPCHIGKAFLTHRSNLMLPWQGVLFVCDSEESAAICRQEIAEALKRSAGGTGQAQLRAA